MNNIKKYMTLGAVLAGSAFMVSCDGDDGQDGQDGTTTVITTGAGLDNADLTNDIFTLGSLRMIFDPVDGVVFDGEPELEFDFDSPQIATFENTGIAPAIFALDNQNGAVAPQVLIENLQAPGDGTFTIDAITGDTDNDGDVDVADQEAFENMTFTTTKIVQNTYTGTFLTQAAIEQDLKVSENVTTFFVNFVLPGVIPGGAGNAVIGQETLQSEHAGAVATVDIQDLANNVLGTADTDQVVLRYVDANNNDETVIWVATLAGGQLADAGVNVDLSGFAFDYDAVVAADAIQTVPAGEVRRVSSTINQDVTGVFRLEIDSTQGGNENNLDTNF